MTVNVPGHAPHDFRLLSIPFYLVPALPRLLDEAFAQAAKPGKRNKAISRAGKRVPRKRTR